MASKIIINYDQFKHDAIVLASKIEAHNYDTIYAIPRGGVPLAMLLSERLTLRLLENGENITPRTLIVDDLVDSGKTIEDFSSHDIAVLYTKVHSPKVTYSVRKFDSWIELPYEKTDTDELGVITRLLEVIGENPNREGLLDTPKRVIKFYKEFLEPPKFNFTVFDAEGYDEMIIQKDIPFFSLCEHHMAPFFGTATVAYIPDKKIVGLSKLARCVEHYSRRLQNQERITSQVAEKLQNELNPGGVAVTLKARHFCMEMRGVKTHDVTTTTTKLIGAFKDNPETRQELFNA